MLKTQSSPIHENNSILNKISGFEFATKYVEIKCQLDATEDFIADLIACSTCFGHHYAEGYVSGLQDTAASCKPDT